MSRTPESLSDESESGLLPISECDELSNITYSHEATIAAFQDYYAFLRSMYLDDEAVVSPPEGGWPEITSESLKDLGKSEEVVALLRELPYIRARYDGKKTHAAGHCPFSDWTKHARNIIEHGEECAETAMVLTEYMFTEQSVPSHVFGFSENKDNKILLDTHLGLIFFWECPFQFDPNLPFKPLQYEPYLYFPEEEAEWMGCAWAIPDFFEVLKYLFRELKYVPMSRQIVEEAWLEDPSDQETAGARPMVQELFRQHGWPDLQHYQKRECMKAVEKAVEDRFPETFFPI